MTTALTKLSPQQNSFLQALQDDSLVDLPKRERLRWCADKAGYAKTTTITQIIDQIGQETITKILERRISRLAFEAVMALEDALTGEINPIETKIRVDVARDILDRVVPKKEPKAASQAPLVQIILPGKVPTEVIDG